MEVKIKLHGYADGLGGKECEKFLANLALYNTVGNMDWVVDISCKSKTGSHLVYEPWIFEITAKRIHASLYEKRKKPKHDYTTIKLQFESKSYSKQEIYKAIVDSLKKNHFVDVNDMVCK